jgi:phage-related baseplate assembly protein
MEGQTRLENLSFVIAVQRTVLDTVDQGAVEAIALGLREDRTFLATRIRVPQFAVCQAEAH